MERPLIRVPLLLVEWLNPIRSGAIYLLYYKITPRRELFSHVIAYAISNTLPRYGIIIA